MSDLPRRVRSTTSQPGERLLTWRDDEIYPYTYLDGYRIERTPRKTVSHLVDSKGGLRGHPMYHDSLTAALAYFGWEAV